MREQFRSMEQERENKILLNKMLLIMNRPNKQPGSVTHQYSSHYKNMDRQSGGPGFVVKNTGSKKSNARASRSKKKKSLNQNMYREIQKGVGDIVEEEAGTVQPVEKFQIKTYDNFGQDADEIIKSSQVPRSENSMLVDYRIIHKGSRGSTRSKKKSEVTMFNPKRERRNSNTSAYGSQRSRSRSINRSVDRSINRSTISAGKNKQGRYSV